MRIRVIKQAVVFCFVVLLVCLWFIQCVQRDRYYELSQKNRIRVALLPAPRGHIYDRNRDIIAANRVAFDCMVIPSEFSLGDDILRQLSSIIGVEAYVIKDSVKKQAGLPFTPVVIKRDIGKETAIALSERNMDFPGLFVQTYPLRYYPAANAAAHVSGYIGKIGEEELDALKEYGYKSVDYVGRAGLELSYDDYLRGEDGGIQTEVDSAGRQLRVLGIKEPTEGKSLMLTIDMDIQKHIHSLLAENNGAVIVMTSGSGEILGLVSKPDFDPNIFVSPNQGPAVIALLRSREHPLINRGISGTYAPGSTFKIVTSSAALESGRLGKNDHLNCGGSYTLGNRTFSCWKEQGHGSQAITEGIKNSCNVFFYQAGKRAGVDALGDYAYRYGFGRTSGIDLPFEAAGIVPTRMWKRWHTRQPWYEGDTLNYAIGQGYLSVTPMQLLRMANAVATGGRLVRPSIVKRIDNVDTGGGEERHVGVSQGTLETIKKGMEKAVNDAGGTAFRAIVDGVTVAGKTGTAEVGSGQTHAWFVGFAPAEQPKVSVVVFVEHGGRGGDKPARLASAIFARLKEKGYL